MPGLFRKVHDRLTEAGFAGAALFVCVIAVSFWYEVIARYFFSAPTTWAYDLASFSLCPMIFLAMPAMSRRGTHITLAYLTEGLSPARSRILKRLVLLAAMSVCLFCAWIAGAETYRQYMRGVVTITALPVSKWWISIFIPYGMLSSGLYFLRQLFGEPATEAALQDSPV